MNKRITIEIPEKTHQLIARYADQAGTPTDAYVLELLEQHLEDLYDLATAEAAMERMRNGERSYPLEEVKRELDLDD